jgi:aerobic-type carbon monoxide dehydrogenase small subunit (CoxS/CutS family)
MTKRDKQVERDEKRKDVVSRRGFLKGAGLTAAGAAIIENGLIGVKEAKAEEAALPKAKVIGPTATTITLRINGASKNIEVEPRTTLAEVLRYELGMTGTKVVCDRGSCSACTVWMDGAPVCSCMTFAFDAVGRSITTIEGLAKGDELHPVQEAFIEHDAMQCGFCTPGMIMSCAALVNKNPNPTLDDVKRATRGNLCRCGTYPKVFEATLEAAKKMKKGGARLR